MWVKFVSKTSEGTLFNFGNPLNSNSMNSSNAQGFRLDTKVNQYDGKYYRYIRLVVRDWTNSSDAGGRVYRIRDNHFGTEGLNRFDHRSFGSNVTNYPEVHRAFPQISTDNLDEWYFICATFNPNIVEPNYDNTPSTFRRDTQYWLNHKNQNGDLVSNSGLGAKCKVEIISRTSLLQARGYRVRPLTVNTQLEVVSSFTYEFIEDPIEGEEDSPPPSNPPVANFQYEYIEV